MPSAPGIFVILPLELLALFKAAAQAMGVPVSKWLREAGVLALGVDAEAHRKGQAILRKMAAAKAEVVRANGRKRVAAPPKSATNRLIDRVLRSASAEVHVILRSPSHTFYFMAHPSAREPGRFQLTGFDSKGQPYGHTTWDTLEDAVASAQGKRVNGQIPVGNASFQIAEK